MSPPAVQRGRPTEQAAAGVRVDPDKAPRAREAAAAAAAIAARAPQADSAASTCRPGADGQGSCTAAQVRRCAALKAVVSSKVSKDPKADHPCQRDVKPSRWPLFAAEVHSAMMLQNRTQHTEDVACRSSTQAPSVGGTPSQCRKAAAITVRCSPKPWLILRADWWPHEGCGAQVG